MKIEKLVRKEIYGLPFYDAESIFPKKLDKKIIKLDLNENPVSYTHLTLPTKA